MLTPDQIHRTLSEQKADVIARTGIEVVHDYAYLGALLIRNPSAGRRQQLEADPQVAAVAEPEIFRTTMSATQSSNQLQAGIVESLGQSGQGASVLVTDTGLSSGFNNHPDFGVCTAPGQPAATCQMASYTVLDPAGHSSHGMFVAGIVARTARTARIHFFDVGCSANGGNCIDGALAMSALNWAIQNAAALNIVAHNMSWGVPPGAASCSRYDSTFAPAVAVGIAQVASSGNDGVLTQLGSPACSNYVVSVGNADSRPSGSQPSTWVAFPSSNVSPDLDLVAPGTDISAGGYSGSGTSMASPHVAGAFTVLNASNAWANLPPAQLEGILKATGANFLDARVGQVFPVPQFARARPRELRVDNPLNVAYSVAPPGTRSCGAGCFLMPETTVTLTLPEGYAYTGCSRLSATSCTLQLSETHRGSIYPLALLGVIAQQVDTEELFASGFE